MTDIAKRLREIATRLKSEYAGEFDNWAMWIGLGADEIDDLQDALTRLMNDLQAHKDALAQSEAKP
jgi:2'-5' RNA ligase